MDGCTGLTSVTFPDKVNGYISMDEKSSEYLLSIKNKEIVYHISNVPFPKSLFDGVRKNKLSAQEVFAIKNTEQRRVAYQMMDKTKMKELQDFQTLDAVADDGYGHPMSVISFKVDGFNKPFKYLNCFCPSTGREYSLETKQDTCLAAKAKSFGFDEITFNGEW
jgi:hypothetical protein